ncbi:MAG: molybdopterin-synthase adenylyltransferase MoeB [Pseudomonadales bacterium]
MNDQQLLRYSRHIALQGFDIEGQERVNQSSVLIVGAGGLGCPAAMYLAASGVGKIILVDDDVVELSNLQRQIAHGNADIGKTKVASLAESLRALNTEMIVEEKCLRLAGDVLTEQVAAVDVVLDCSDNFTTRLAINRACVAHKKPLVSGAAIRGEGQVSVFNFSAESPCYACLYGEQDAQENLSCSDSGVLSPLVGIVGAMQAAEALKIIAGYGEPLDGRVLLLDATSMQVRTMVLKKDLACSVCGDGA